MTWVLIRCVRCEGTTWVILEKCQQYGFPVCRRVLRLFESCPNSAMVLAGRVAA